MALTNRDQVGRALDLLQAGLAPFIKREVDRGIQNNRVGKDALRGSAAHESQMRSFPEGWDASALLGAMLDLWDAVFRFPLGPAERSLIHDLRRARNDWAHQKTFTGDAAFRALDDAERLLRAVSAPEAAQLAPMKDELLRVRFEERSREYAKRQKRKAGREWRADRRAQAVARGHHPARGCLQRPLPAGGIRRRPLRRP